MRTSGLIAAAVAAGVMLGAGVAQAAELEGGAGAGDRVAELEVTVRPRADGGLEGRVAGLMAAVIRNGDRTVSLTMHGYVRMELLIWDEKLEELIAVSSNGATRRGCRTPCPPLPRDKGFNMIFEIKGARASGVDDGLSLKLRPTNIYVEGDRLWWWFNQYATAHSAGIASPGNQSRFRMDEVVFTALQGVSGVSYTAAFAGRPSSGPLITPLGQPPQ